jgi:UPF0755 protein
MKNWLLAVFFIVAVMLAAAGLLYRELRHPYRGYSGSLVIEIKPGTRSAEVAQLLVSRGVLAHRAPFVIMHTLDRLRHRSLKAGEYLFDRPVTPLEVYRKLVQGGVDLHTVVIPEGSNRFDMALILEQQLGLNAEAFLEATEQPWPIRDLDPEAPTLEGYLFPDTYRFPRGISPATVALTMLERFRHVLGSRLPSELCQSPARLHEAVTLASLVEKETPDSDERPLIAGVFARRLKAKMPLQCDPTVVYAARLDHEPAGGLITQDELALASPYNTYRNPGLPPGPICSPGESSIRAALDPAPGDALYFVANNHGGHFFAATLAEHQRNVRRYRHERVELRQAAASLRPAPDAPAGTGEAVGKKAADAQGDTEAKSAGPTNHNPARRKRH